MRLSLADLRRHPVLLAGVADRAALARLEPFFEVDLVRGADASDREVLRARLAGKSALVDAQGVAIDEALLAALPHLKAVCRVGAAISGIDLEACTRAGVIATNTPDLGAGDAAQRAMTRIAADNLVAAFGFGRDAGHPANLLNVELRCVLGCCL